MKALETFTPLREEDTGYINGYGKDDVENYIKTQERAQDQRDAYREIKERENAAAKDQRQYLKVFDKGSENLSESDLVDLGVLFRLTTNLYYDGAGLLAAGKRDALKPLKKADLMKLLNKSKNGINAAIERLEATGAIRKEKKGRTVSYHISEDLVSFGKGTGGKHFTKLYRTKAQQLLKTLTDSEAGLIFKCLPYVHYSTHLLVLRPYEKDLTKIEAIRGAELAHQLGIDRKSFNNLTSKIKRKGAMMFLDVGTRGKGYAINPDLCDRGYTGDCTERVRAYFTALNE